MVQPISMSESMSVGDVLDIARTSILFPHVPLLSDRQLRNLTLTGVNVSVPGVRIGQIRVPLFGHVLSFRGDRDHGNNFTASFFLDKNAEAMGVIMLWQEYCSRSRDNSSWRKKDYAVDSYFQCFDAKGELAFQFRLSGTWPSQAAPPTGGENSDAARCEVTFSVDFIDLVAGGPLGFRPFGEGFLGQGAGLVPSNNPASGGQPSQQLPPDNPNGGPTTPVTLAQFASVARNFT